MSTVSVTVRVTDRSGNTATDTATAMVDDFDLVVNAGQDAAVLINAQPAGTAAAPRRILVNGFHRLTTALVPKNYQHYTINGTLDGSVVLTGWVADGANRWSVTGKLPAAYTDNGVPEFTTGIYANACKQREDVFVDGVMLRRVTTLTAVAAGTYFADYTANKVYLGQNPAGKTVTMNRTQFAIRSTAANVKIEGDWIVQRFATPSQSGAVQPEGPDWEFNDGLVQYNHAIGLRLVNSHRTVVRRTRVNNNGQLGYANTSSNDTQWLSCRFNYNNNAQYRWGDWESGGGKSSRSLRVWFWDCWAIGNRGVGFWNDIDNDGIRITWCRSEDNLSCGGRDEIGYNSDWAYCQIHRNGLGHRPDSGAEATAERDPGFFATGAINVNSSGGRNGGRVWIHDCDMFDNRNGVVMQQRTRTDPAWLLKNVLVEDCKVRSAILINPATGARWVDANTIPVSSHSGIGALSQTATRSAEIYSTDVIFRNNRYAATEMIMRWTGSAWRLGTLAQAQAAGQEVGSHILDQP